MSYANDAYEKIDKNNMKRRITKEPVVGLWWRGAEANVENEH